MATDRVLRAAVTRTWSWPHFFTASVRAAVMSPRVVGLRVPLNWPEPSRAVSMYTSRKVELPYAETAVL